MFDSSYKANLNTVWGIITRKLWIIIVVSVAAAVAFASFAYFFIPFKYSSEAKFYVYNNKSSGVMSQITSQDLNAAQTLVETYIVIIKSNTVLERIIESSGVKYNAEELSDMISAGSLSGTEVFYLKVTSTDKKEALKISEAIVEVVPSAITDVVKGGDVSVIDHPKLDEKADSPSIPIAAFIGFFLGAIIAFSVFFIREVTDIAVYTEQDLKKLFDYPIVGAIPTIDGDTETAVGSKKRVRKQRGGNL